jgi:hypothetical protein
MNLTTTLIDRLEASKVLVPGAGDRLKAINRSGAANAPRTAGALLAYLIGDGQAWLSREGREAFRGTTPLEFVLSKLALKPGGSKKLFDALAAGAAETTLPTGLEPPPADAHAAKIQAWGRAGDWVEEQLERDEHRGWIEGETFLSPGATAAKRFLESMVSNGFVSAGADLDEMANSHLWVNTVPGRVAAERIAKWLLTRDDYFDKYGPATGAVPLSDVVDAYRDGPADADAIGAELARDGQYNW